MAGEGPYLDGEDEYLEEIEDQNECGTQVDGDFVAVLHESYNFTQVDDNQYPLDTLNGDEELCVDFESDEEHRDEGDESNFPDLAVTQTQKSQIVHCEMLFGSGPTDCFMKNVTSTNLNDIGLTGERQHGGDGGLANSSDIFECGIDGPVDGPEHAERRDDEEEVVNIDMKDNEAEEHVEEKKKKMEEESEKEKEDEDEEKVEGEEKGEEKRGEEDEDGDEDFQEMVNIDMKDNEAEEHVEEKKKKMEEESEKEKEEEETEEGEEKGEEKRGEEDEDGDEDEDEIVDICVDDTQSAATAIFGEDVNHFPYSLSGHCGFAVSDPMSDSAHSASITAGSMHKPTSLAAVELECAACPAPPHAEESKEQELCLSNPPHAFPSPSPLAFPYTSDSLSATPMAARSSDMRELVAVPNDGSSTKRPDTQSSSTQYTQPGLLKCDYEGSSAAHTCLAATHVVPCEILMTEASASGKAAEAGAEATSGVPESIPIPISQYASSPVWATKGSETAGSYVGYTLTSSFGAGEGEVEDDGGREVRAVASMLSKTNTAELVVEADVVAAVKKVSEGAPTTVVSADVRRGSVAEGLADVWVENRRGVEVGLSSRLRGSVLGVFGVPVLSISQRSCPVDTSRSACPVTADREAKKEALIADFERKQAELKALYLTKIQELELEREPDVVADADRFEGSDAASGTQSVSLSEGGTGCAGPPALAPSRMFHTVRRSALLTGASPAKGAEEDLGLALRKPKRRFAKSPLDRGAAGTRDGESAMDVEVTVTPGLHSSREDESVSKKVRDRERDEFSFVDSQDFNEGAPSEGGAGGMAVDAVAPLLLVSADKDRVDDIIDTDDESVLRSRDTSSSKGTAKANAKEELPAHSPSSVSLIHVERNGPKKRLSKGKKQSPKKSPKGKAPVNEASPLPLPAKETAQVEDVPAQSPHDDDVPNSICLKTSKWRDVWKILKDVGWYWKKGSGMVDCYYIRPGHSTASLKSFNGVHVFCSTNDVWSFLTSVCEKRARAAQMLPVSPSISPSGIKEDVSEDKDEVAASETNVGHGCPSQQTQEHQMQDQDPYETKTAEGGIDDWVPHVMTIPWKILYLVHLTNEGWSWNYGHGLNDECYYAPGFGPVEESKKKEMTEAQVLEQESRVPIANVSKFSSKEDVRRYIRRTRWPDYEPSELSQREEAEAVASFGEDWNLARNRKRRKSNPCFPYNPEEYVNNTCDMSQTVQDLKEQLPTKSKKSKNSVDDASGSDRDRRTLPDEGGRNSCPEPSPSGRSKSSRQSNSPANRAIAGKITNNSTHNRQISCFDQPVVNSSTSTNRNHADAGDYEDEDDQPVMAAVMERREKERLLRMKVGRAEDAEGSGSGSMPSAGPHTHTKHHRHDNRSAVHHREVSGDIQSVDSSVSVSVSALGPRDTGTGTGTVERQMVPKGVLKNGLLEPYGERQRQRQRQQGGGIDSGRAGYKGSGMRQVMMGVEDRDRDRDDRSPHDLYGHEHDGGGDADTQQQDVSPITSLHWKDTNWQYGDNPPSRNSQRSTGKRSQSASSSSSVVSTPYNTFTANISAEMQTVKTGSLPKSRIVASSGPGSSMLMTAATAERGRPRGKGQGPGSGTSRLSLGLFSGLTFILSGITEEEREAVAARIQRCGGTVISQLPFLKEMEDHLTLVRRASANNSSPPYCDPTVKVGTLSQGIILLSRPTNFRKTNYLLVLATGGTLLHHLWAARCMDANALLPREEYLLPSGASALWPSYIFPKVRPPPAFGVLACLSVLNFAGEKWASLLAVCGMNVSPHNEALLKAFAPGKVIDRRMYGVDIVVVDCLSYCESVTRRRMNKTPSKRDKEAGVLSSLELAAIEGCVSREGQLSVHEGGIKVVTIDWVVHCLQLGEQVAFNSNDVFALPLDPINRPLGHKNDSKKGNGERFMKYDVCYYRRSNEDKDLLGQIRGFSRKNPSSPMQVRIRPLVLSGGYQGIQTPRCPRQGPSPSRSSLSSNKAKQTTEDTQLFVLKDRELTPARDQEEILMDASVLTGKAAVLSQKSAGALAYALWDRDVFVSSEEWESAHREEMGFEEEEDDDESAQMKAQMSQDY